MELFGMLLGAHERETRALRRFAGTRVLDVVWCARVWCERVGVEGEGEGGERVGMDGSGDVEGGGGDEESVRERVGGIVRRTGRALGDVAGARVGGVVRGGMDEVGKEEERKVRDKVKEVERVFGKLVEVAMQKVEGMRYLVVELKLLKAVLRSVLEKDEKGQGIS